MSRKRKTKGTSGSNTSGGTTAAASTTTTAAAAASPVASASAVPVSLRTTNASSNGNGATTVHNASPVDTVASSDCRKLRRHLESIQGIPKDSKALQSLLTTLQDLQQHAEEQEQQQQQLQEQRQRQQSNGTSGSHPVVNVVTSNDSNNDKSTTTSRAIPVATSISTTIPSHNGHNQMRRRLFTTLFTLCIDMPLWLACIASVGLTTYQAVATHYYLPQLELMKWDYKPDKGDEQITYYDRTCGFNDISASNTSQLLIPTDASAEYSRQHMLRHGVSVYQNVLTDETATAVREYIQERNRVEKGFYVIENAHRKSFGLTMEHPSIQKALQEIASHPQLNPAMEAIMGVDPAIIEFTAITSMNGAVDQFFHQDVVEKGSGFKYARNFVPSYAFFVTVQDTTSTMGATEVCPGTHLCNDVAREICREPGVAVKVSTNSTTGIWEKGTAALVNQQTIHRGTAHTDPIGGDRVVFIITFAPRYNSQMESRLIGQGGSYSLLWNYWGHTLQDYTRRMVEPWLSLRALGIYKPKSAHWGWDFITVASMRISNDDNGYSRDDLVDFIQRGGFPFLPSFLQASEVLKTVPEESSGWLEFAVQTLDKVVEFGKMAHQWTLGLYGGIVLFLNSVFVLIWLFRSKERRKQTPIVPSFMGHVALWRVVLRLVLMYGSTLLLGHLAWQHIESTQWARNIRQGRQFHAARNSTEEMATAPLIPTEWTDVAPQDLPSTLPYATDILVDTRYSHVLESYKDLLQHAHPGNRRYYTYGIAPMALHYHDLPPTLRVQLVQDIAWSMRIDWFSRFLTQNIEGNWREVVEPTVHIHHDLAKNDETRVGLGVVLSHWEHLRAEAKVGYFRSYTMSQRQTLQFLEDLHEKLIGWVDAGIVPTPVLVAGAKKKPSKDKTTNKLTMVPSTIATKPVMPLSAQAWWNSLHKQKSVFLPTPPEEEPFPGAWVKDGDVVEAQYHGRFNEWYRARVIKSRANGSLYDVLYDDGEIDPGLPRLSVRPFEPYQVGEVVAARVAASGSDDYYEGRIVAVHPPTDDSEGPQYTVDTSRVGRLYNVETKDMRRYDYELTLGVIVDALFYGDGDTWYRGQIVGVHPDGHFDILYEDGDQENYVHPDNVRIATN